MKKSLQKTVAFALALIMIVAMTAVFASAEETGTTTGEASTSAASSEAVVTDTTEAPTTTTEADFSEGMKNVALGAAYSYAKLVGDPGSEEEGAAGFANGMLNDDACTKLTDGEKSEAGTESKKSAGPAGTCRTIRVKFDFGSEKKVSKIALFNFINTYDRDYNGSPAGNRGFELDSIMVQAGEDLLAMFEVEIDREKKLYPGSSDAYKVYLTLKEEVTTRYLWIDLQTAQPKGQYDDSKDTGAYVISLDEIEIYGEDSGEPVATESAVVTEPAETEIDLTNPDAVYDLGIEAPATANAGDKINVVISAKNIKTENGIIAVAFTLKYDAEKVTPDVVADDPEKADVYMDLLTVVPKYIMSAGGMDIEANAWESMSRNYDGYYEFKFNDLVGYPMQKSGTEVNSKVKADGEFVITVPFTVKDGVADGEKLYFIVSDVEGTDAGAEGAQPFSIVGNGAKAVVAIGEIAVPTDSQATESKATESKATESKATESKATESKATESKATESKATETKTTGSAATESQPTPKPPKTGSTSIAIIAVLALLSLAGCAVVVKKASK